MENLSEVLADTKRMTGVIVQEYPAFMKGLGAFGQACEGGDLLDKKTSELIAVALSVVQQCTYCIAFHVKAALDAGASKDEIMGASFMAVLLGGGPAFMYAKEVRKAIDDLSD
jgi:AhpD family alkylhydroperoxidase